VITRGGITTDLLRNLLCEEGLPPKLLAARMFTQGQTVPLVRLR
jgi:hypothetical protein